MKQKLFVIFAAAALGLLGIVAVNADALKLNDGPELRASACGPGALVVNVEYLVVNTPDSGTGGNDWALDTVHRHLQVWRNGANLYCAIIRDEGEFTTLAGRSPGYADNGNVGSVGAGVEGKMRGGTRSVQFTGVWNPQQPTHGHLTTVDCTVVANCVGVYGWRNWYFSATSGYDLAWWGWIYRTKCNGTWINASDGNHGDISGLASAHCGDNHGHDGHDGHDD